MMDWLDEQEWSMGNGQCPSCYGNQPGKYWWTDTIGHEKDCKLALFKQSLGREVEWEHENPDRAIGEYVPSESGVGPVVMIRASDPDKERKLTIARKQWKKKLKRLKRGAL